MTACQRLTVALQALEEINNADFLPGSAATRAFNCAASGNHSGATAMQAKGVDARRMQEQPQRGKEAQPGRQSPQHWREIVMRTRTAVALALALAGSAALPPRAVAQGSSAATNSDIVTHVQTASELAAVCDPAWAGVPRLEAIAYCQGFLTSFGQYHTLLYPQGGPARSLFCVPRPGPTVAQSGLAFAAWARGNPQYGNEPALDALLRWAQAAFPCPTSPPARSQRSMR